VLTLGEFLTEITRRQKEIQLMVASTLRVRGIAMRSTLPPKLIGQLGEFPVNKQTKVNLITRAGVIVPRGVV